MKLSDRFSLLRKDLFKFSFSFILKFLHGRLFYLVYASRATTFVFIGNFAPPLRSASRAIDLSTPSTSNKILPGRTSISYPWGSPLPLPMPTSAAFCVNGLSGNTRIQIFPALSSVRLIVLRADSSWFDLIRACDCAFNPKEPKASVIPRVSGETFLGFLRPVCHFLNFTFLGNNIFLI